MHLSKKKSLGVSRLQTLSLQDTFAANLKQLALKSKVLNEIVLFKLIKLKINEN